MANVVADVTALVTKAIKQKSTVVQAPSKWAADAGHTGSAASALRKHIGRASGNGCGRTARYPKVTAEGMLELIELGHQYADAEGAKAQTIAKRIGSKLRPATKSGGRAAKAQAKTRKARAKTAA